MTRFFRLVALLCAIGPGFAGGDPPLVDEDRIYREMADLEDRTGTIDPGSKKKAIVTIQKGVKAHDRHEWEEAIRLYRRALEEDPLSATAYYELALSFHAQGELVAALENTIRSIALDPNREPAYVLKGSVEDDLGEPARSLATYDRLLDVNPTSYMGLLNKAITLMKLGKYEDAETVLHRAREAHPQEAAPYLRLSQVARAQDFNYDEERHLERFLELGAADSRAAAAKKRLEELRNHEIEVPPETAYADIELAIEMARISWKTTKHREQHPEARGYRLTFEEEKAVLQDMALGMWRKKKAENPAAAHAYLDMLLKIDDAGFFEPYVYHQRQQQIGQTAGEWLTQNPERVTELLTWAEAEGLTDKGSGGSAAATSSSVDLPARVIAAVEQSKIVYEIASATADTPDFFDRERVRWKSFRFEGSDHAKCDVDIRASVEEAYTNHLPPFLSWVRCFGPEDPQWDEVKLVRRFGGDYRDLAPRLPGTIEAIEGGNVRVGVSSSPGWLIYILSKAAWPREATLREAFEREHGPDVSVSEELFAFTAAVAAYRNSRTPTEGKAPAEPEPYMEQLARIEERGMLRAFVAFEVLHKRYGVSLRRTEPDLARELERYLTEFVFRRESGTAPVSNE